MRLDLIEDVRYHTGRAVTTVFLLKLRPPSLQIETTPGDSRPGPKCRGPRAQPPPEVTRTWSVWAHRQKGRGGRARNRGWLNEGNNDRLRRKPAGSRVGRYRGGSAGDKTHSVRGLLSCPLSFSSLPSTPISKNSS